MTTDDQSWLPPACSRCAYQGAWQSIYLLLFVVVPTTTDHVAQGHLGWRDLLAVTVTVGLLVRALRMPRPAVHADDCPPRRLIPRPLQTLLRATARPLVWVFVWLLQPWRALADLFLAIQHGVARAARRAATLLR